MYRWWVKVRLNPPGEGNAKITTIENLTQDKGAEATYTVDLSGYTEGAYTIDFWIEAQADSEDETILTSATATTAFIYSDQNSTTPVISMSFTEDSEYTQYGTATLEYTVAYGGASKSTVHLQALCGETAVVDTYSEVNNGFTNKWLVPLTLAGTYEFKISIDAYNVSTSLKDVEITSAGTDVPTINLEDSALQLYLSATGKANTQADRDVWKWKNTTCQFEGFNWSTNGWVTDAQNQTSLHLTNGAKLAIPFAMFSAANTDNRGAQATGKTIELDFKVSNVRDPNAILIDGASWTDREALDIYSGIVGQGEKICINLSDLHNYHTPEVEAAMEISAIAATNGLRAYITDDERIHVTFVIQSKTEQGSKRLVYTYINGVISGLLSYTDNSLLRDVDNNRPSYLTFDSTYGDIDLYGVRVYSKKFTDDEVLYNYAADQSNNELRTFVKRNNDALDSNGEISVNSVAALKNMPYIVWTDCRQTSDKKGKEGITDSNPGLPTGKKDFRWCEFYYVDPAHPERNIGDINHKVLGVIYAQGTSSLDYPVKNIRMRIREKDADGNPQDKYSLLPAVPIDNLNSPNAALALEAAAEQAKWENVPAVRLFTFKADYMDSSMSHNTGTGNVLAALYESVGLKTPAQTYWPDKTLVTNIVGTPCLGFYQPYGSTTVEYIGRYNFNLDKAEHDLFGFNPYYVLNEVPEGSTATPTVAESFGVLRNGDYLQAGFMATLDEEFDPEKEYYTAPDLNSRWNGTNDTDFQAYVDKKTGQGPLYEYVDAPYTIQCWEFLDNGAALCGFRSAFHDGDDLGLWTAAFESRFPEHVTERASDKRGFMRLVNWINSTDQSKVLSEDEYTTYITNGDWETLAEQCEPYFTALARKTELEEAEETDTEEYTEVSATVASLRTSLGSKITDYNFYVNKIPISSPAFATGITYGSTTYTHDTKEYRLAKFCNELETYMDLDFTIFYYVLTEALVMIDSRAKNMMMCSFDVDTVHNTGHWFPIFYDMDTVLGLTNTGVLRFRYDTDDAIENGVYNAAANYGVYNSQGVWEPNAKYSVLWANLREGFQTQISTMYNRLRTANKFSYNFLSNSYNDAEADSFAEIYDNKDAKYKYIDPYGKPVIINGEPSEVIANYLHAAQGTRSLHREYFLKHRFTYLDSKYPTYGVGTHDIRFRLYDADGARRHPDPSKNQQFRLTSASTQYGVAKVGNGSDVPPVKLEANVPTWTRVPIGLDTLNEKEAYLFSMGDIYDIGDLSDKFPVEINIEHKVKLRSLKVGNSSDDFYTDIAFKLSGWKNMPLLETLDLQKLKIDPSGNIDLSECYYFQTLLAKGSDLKNITLPVGGNIKRLEFPATMQSLSSRDNVFFDTFTDPTALSFEGYSSLNSIRVENCPLIDTKTLINNIKNANRQLVTIRLPDVNWEIDATTDWCEFDSADHVRDIKILDYIA